MAKSKDNNATHGMSGQVNQFVYRQRFGETLVSKPPVQSGSFSDAQKAVHDTFKRAALYARAILQNAAIKLDYKKKAKRGQLPFNLAVADYFKAPEIVSVNISGLTANPGGKISAVAIDDFRVESVTVRIDNSNGSLIEEGHAELQADGITWSYTTTASGGNTSGNVVTIIATDLPGNSILEEKTV
jgi:hypothetical protein